MMYQYFAKRKVYYGLLVTIALSLGFLIILKTNFTLNNRFVVYAILGFIAIFCYGYLLILPSTLKHVVLLVIFMLGFSFAMVPIYNVFCDVTGLNGKMDLSVVAATPKGVVANREITVEFVVNKNQHMPWQFKPKHERLVVKPGELARTAYYAKNPTKKTMIAQAIPSISPAKASKYFKKIECFCFDSQKLGSHETAYLPLQFYLDPQLPADIPRLTLSYTLFDITDHNWS